MLEAFKSLYVSLCKFCVLNVSLSGDIYELCFEPRSGLCTEWMQEWRNSSSHFLQLPAARSRALLFCHRVAGVGSH